MTYYGGLQRRRSGYGWAPKEAPIEGADPYAAWQDSPGYKAYLDAVNKGGTSAGVTERYGSPSYQFYQEQMRNKDPMGLMKNLEGYAKKRYGPAARGVHDQINAGMRRYRESTGGLRAGGVNPNMDAYTEAFMSAQKAGATGNIWAELSNAEQGLRQQALESTGQYRKGMADSAADWARSVGGATATDESLRMQGAGNLAGLELQGAGAMSNQLLQLLMPLLQTYAQKGGTMPDLASSDVQKLLRMLGLA
jgi:hypothetical protein